MRRTAVTGIASFLGSRVLRGLVEGRGPEAVITVDIASPPEALGVRHHGLDFTQPGSDQRLLELLRAEEVDTVVHCAFFTNPRRDTSHAHELESIGTLNLLAAAAAAGVSRVIVRSFTAVYGARGQNPNFLTEDHPLPPSPSLPWVRDKLEAEQHAAAFARRYPGLSVTVLRFAPLLGPGVHNFYTRIFDHRVVPLLMGYDPLVQLLHPDDAVSAFLAAIERAPGGAFNVVPSRPIPILTAYHLAEKIPAFVPHPIAYAGADLLWAVGLGAAPGGFVDYVRHLFVADGEKARTGIGFTPRWSSRDSVTAYIRYRHPRSLWRAVEAPS
jgi:UDP-glucose 4-epimerase